MAIHQRPGSSQGPTPTRAAFLRVLGASAAGIAGSVVGGASVAAALSPTATDVDEVPGASRPRSHPPASRLPARLSPRVERH